MATSSWLPSLALCQVTQTETQLIKDKPPFQSLLTILRFEVWTFETTSHCHLWPLVNRERSGSKPDYSWPSVRAVGITTFSRYSPPNAPFGYRIITWFYPLCTYAFAPLACFGLPLTPDSCSKMIICWRAACQTPTEWPGNWWPNWFPRRMSCLSLYILPMSALMRIALSPH